MFFSKNNIFIGISPLNWTNDDMPNLGSTNTFEQILSEASLTRYSGVEIGVTFPQDINTLIYHTKLRNLKIASQWFGAYLSTEKIDIIQPNFLNQLIKLKTLNASCINICDLSYNLFRSNKSMFTNKPTLSDSEWSTLCTNLNILGKLAQKYNIKLCYHHHMGTVIQTYEEISYLLNHTNPKFVHLCLDTADLILADIDPISFIHKFSSRIAHVHLKDVYSEKMYQAKQENFSFREAIRQNCFTVPGDGNGYINFLEIFQALDEINYQGWLIVEAELNPELSNPFEYALKARYFLSAMLDL